MKRNTSSLPAFRMTLVLAPLLVSISLFAQQPVFRFDNNASQVTLDAHSYAWDCIAGDDDRTLVTINNIIPGFMYSGGVADWGAGASLTAQDGPVSASANPLVRLDGDNTQVVRIAYKAWMLDSASVFETSPCYIADGFADTHATFSLLLDNLVAGDTYDIQYVWTLEARADEEHDDPAIEDDPGAGTIDLNLTIGAFGPGPLFSAAVDNAAATPEPGVILDDDDVTMTFTAGAPSLPVTIDMNAYAEQTMVYPTRDDAARAFLRGTLTLVIRHQSPPPADPIELRDSGVIISEVVAGAVGVSNPRCAELTNCGINPVQFGPADELIVFPDGMAAPSAIVNLAGILLNPGDSFVIAASDFAGDLDFLNTYGFNADLYAPGLFGDGNDVYALMTGGDLHDVYGVIGVDAIPPFPGLIEPWAYRNSHAHRRPNQFPNKGAFDVDNWVVAPLFSIAGANDATSMALAAAQTTPGVHDCLGHAAPLLGDMNCDGVVSLADLNPMALALIDPAGYAAAFPACSIASGDMNADGAIDGLDIALFIAAL
ncbi:MAG TPA: hypothetical protein P5081_20940 [Phycisphaerae bacterium]|nr:hypothetical protein [Phycisphaerae bacterium]HRW55348.1 hypothetical protein [Phycisphaerae bacterium]